MITTKSDLGELRRALAIEMQPDRTHEIRCPKAGRAGTISGYFNRADLAAEAVMRLNGIAAGIYITPNPVKDALLARASNRLKERAETTTSDRDVAHLARLLIDCDAVRPAGVSSSDDEHAAALSRARECRDWLVSRGWPPLALGDSGNGGHVLGAIDLPNDEASVALMKRVLESLAFRFGDDRVIIDTTCYNPSRIWKLYGTWARKGDDTRERPHRLSRLLDVPELRVISKTLLEGLAGHAPSSAAPPRTGHTFTATDGDFDVEAWMSRHGLTADHTGTHLQAKKWILSCCPFNPDHDGDSAIFQQADGRLGFNCFHQGCAGNDWHALRDLVEPGWRERSFPFSRQKSTGPDEPPTWDDPIPFDKAILPPFPIEALPVWGQQKVEAVTGALQVPADLPALSYLDMLATSCGGKVEIEVAQGWREQTNLFTAVAMLSGERKTPAVETMTRPALKAQRELQDAMADEIAAATNKKRILESSLEKAQKEAARAEGDERDCLTADAETLACELAHLVVPPEPRLLADDCTPEALARMLAQQSGHIAVISDEGGIFDIMAGRYTKNGALNIDVFLKGHSGSPLFVDRVGRESLYVEKPALTVGLAVQPDVIAGLAAKPGFRGRGLPARFLFAVPESRVGSRDKHGTPELASVMARYEADMLALLKMESAMDGDGKPTPHVLVCSPDAADALYDFSGWIEPQLGPFGVLAGIRDWANKLPGAVARIAGLLHVAEHGPARSWTKVVEATTMGAAIRIGSYFIPHALTAFALMGADAQVEHARHVLRWIDRHGQSTFTRRELHQGVRGMFRQAEDLAAPLQVLINRGYVRPVTDVDRSGPGRPSQRFDVNPRWTAARARGAAGSEYFEDFVYEIENRKSEWGQL